MTIVIHRIAKQKKDPSDLEGSFREWKENIFGLVKTKTSPLIHKFEMK